MAHIHTSTATIKVSKLAKGDHAECKTEMIFDEALLSQVESVVCELLGDPNLIVEVVSNQDD